MHGPTGKSLKPEHKGEGTVWQRTLIRPNRTNRQSDDIERGKASCTSPARLGIHQNDDEPRFMLCMAGLFACHTRDHWRRISSLPIAPSDARQRTYLRTSSQESRLGIVAGHFGDWCRYAQRGGDLTVRCYSPSCLRRWTGLRNISIQPVVDIFVTHGKRAVSCARPNRHGSNLR